MAWETYTSGSYQGRPIIYNYYPSRPIGEQYDSAGVYFTWQTKSLWLAHGAAIKFINDTENPMTMSSVKIKSCACHSGGQSFYAWAGYGYAPTNPTNGAGADYSCYIRVSNDDEASYQQSDTFTRHVPALTSSNMNYRGNSSSSAIFGDPPYTGNAGMTLNEYTFASCPEIEPGGIAYIHFDVNNFDSTSNEYTTIRFALDPREMEVYFEPDVDPYIWVYESDHKWHLRQPFYVTSGGKWTSVEKL